MPNHNNANRKEHCGIKNRPVTMRLGQTISCT